MANTTSTEEDGGGDRDKCEGISRHVEVVTTGSSIKKLVRKTSPKDETNDINRTPTVITSTESLLQRRSWRRQRTRNNNKSPDKEEMKTVSYRDIRSWRV